MEEGNEEGAVLLVYNTLFKPIPESSQLNEGIAGLEAELESDFRVKGELECSFSIKLSGTMPDLRKALDDLFDSSGLPFKAKRPSLDPRATTDEHYRGEKEKEERGYGLLRELIEERRGKLGYFGPEQAGGEFSYISPA